METRWVRPRAVAGAMVVMLGAQAAIEGAAMLEFGAPEEIAATAVPFDEEEAVAATAKDRFAWDGSIALPAPTGYPVQVHADPASREDPRFAVIARIPDVRDEVRYIWRDGNGPWVSQLVHAVEAPARVESVRAGRVEGNPAVAWTEVDAAGLKALRISTAPETTFDFGDHWTIR